MYYEHVRHDHRNHGWYIILLGNYNNPSNALNLKLKNYAYLNLRTRNIRFFMPGFIVNAKGIESNRTDKNKAQFDFYELNFLTREKYCFKHGLTRTLTDLFLKMEEKVIIMNLRLSA